MAARPSMVLDRSLAEAFLARLPTGPTAEQCGHMLDIPVRVAVDGMLPEDVLAVVGPREDVESGRKRYDPADFVVLRRGKRQC